MKFEMGGLSSLKNRVDPVDWLRNFELHTARYLLSSILEEEKKLSRKFIHFSSGSGLLSLLFSQVNIPIVGVEGNQAYRDYAQNLNLKSAFFYKSIDECYPFQNHILIVEPMSLFFDDRSSFFVFFENLISFSLKFGVIVFLVVLRSLNKSKIMLKLPNSNSRLLFSLSDQDFVYIKSKCLAKGISLKIKGIEQYLELDEPVSAKLLILEPKP